MKKDIIKNHYRKEAEKWGDSAYSTMEDAIIRQKETELILNFFETHKKKTLKIADIGCGNGYTLDVLSKKIPECEYWGIDITKELLDIAKNRKIANCQFIEESVTSLTFNDNFFDAIYTQRCLINISNWGEQKKALNEIYRVLKPGGYYLMIECFTDGLENYNKARIECGLTEIKETEFNKYFDKELYLHAIKGKFSVIEFSNFLSSHYFIARVLHALITKGEQIKNTEFVKFFSFLPPIGNYSPIQAYILQKVT